MTAFHTALYFVAVLFAIFAFIASVSPINAPPAPSPWGSWSWRLYTLAFLFYLLSMWPR